MPGGLGGEHAEPGTRRAVDPPLGEQLIANRREQTDVCRWVRARRATDGCLVDGNDLVFEDIIHHSNIVTETISNFIENEI